MGLGSIVTERYKNPLKDLDTSPLQQIHDELVVEQAQVILASISKALDNNNKLYRYIEYFKKEHITLRLPTVLYNENKRAIRDKGLTLLRQSADGEPQVEHIYDKSNKEYVYKLVWTPSNSIYDY